MKEFPKEICRETCNIILKENQEKLILETRENFVTKIMLALDNCQKSVGLTFDSRLWGTHRVTIARELLRRFEVIGVYTKQGDYETFKDISNEQEITKDISKIKIEF